MGTNKRKYPGGRNYWLFRESESLSPESDSMTHSSGREPSRTRLSPEEREAALVAAKARIAEQFAIKRGPDDLSRLYGYETSHTYKPEPIDVVRLRKKRKIARDPRAVMRALRPNQPP